LYIQQNRNIPIQHKSASTLIGTNIYTYKIGSTEIGADAKGEAEAEAEAEGDIVLVEEGAEV